MADASFFACKFRSFAFNRDDLRSLHAENTHEKEQASCFAQRNYFPPYQVERFQNRWTLNRSSLLNEVAHGAIVSADSKDLRLHDCFVRSKVTVE